VIDFRHFLIPDLITYPGILLGLGLSFIPGGLTPQQSFIGARRPVCSYGCGFRRLPGAEKGSHGLGDVKLIAMAGALFGAPVALFGLIFASVLGCLIGLPMMLLRKLDAQRHIPSALYLPGRAPLRFFRTTPAGLVPGHARMVTSVFRRP